MEIFPKVLVQGFYKKIEYFIKGVFWANQARKDLFLILQTKKNDFQSKKVKCQKSRKNHFF